MYFLPRTFSRQMPHFLRGLFSVTSQSEYQCNILFSNSSLIEPVQYDGEDFRTGTGPSDVGCYNRDFLSWVYNHSQIRCTDRLVQRGFHCCLSDKAKGSRICFNSADKICFGNLYALCSPANSKLLFHAFSSFLNRLKRTAIRVNNIFRRLKTELNRNKYKKLNALTNHFATSITSSYFHSFMLSAVCCPMVSTACMCFFIVTLLSQNCAPALTVYGRIALLYHGRLPSGSRSL